MQICSCDTLIVSRTLMVSAFCRLVVTLAIGCCFCDGYVSIPPKRTKALWCQKSLCRSPFLTEPRTAKSRQSMKLSMTPNTDDSKGISTASNDNSTGQLTDWVVENLESDDSRITSSSTTKAGENDTLPSSGLVIGTVRILAADATWDDDNKETDIVPIRLLLGRNGWGTGVHPTTRLCLEWLCDDTVIQGGETLLDYGCGSGILSIAALHRGARHSTGVDVEAEALVTALRNVELNGYGEERFEGLHTREVLPYGIGSGGGVDICVANILIGQLVRPSMVAAIVSNVAPGGLLCLSGIRPNEVVSLKQAYDPYMEWLDDEYYAELSASDTEGSLESYGFDTGRWARLVGRRKVSGSDDVRAMSELAVS